MLSRKKTVSGSGTGLYKRKSVVAGLPVRGMSISKRQAGKNRIKKT